MVPERIVRHLEEGQVPLVVRSHTRVVAAQRLAASMHVSGYRVAKSVMVEADGERVMAVLPAPDIVDLTSLAVALGAERVRMLGEDEFIDLFPDCELGAEPPFGSVYGLPVVMDGALSRAGGPLVFRAGSHDEVLEMEPVDFIRLERPRLADFAVAEPSLPRFDGDQARAAW